MTKNALGIDATKHLIESIGKLVGDAVDLSKNGLGLGSLSQMFTIVADVKDLVQSVPGALPELMDLDAQESTQIGAAAYDMVRKIATHIKN